MLKIKTAAKPVIELRDVRKDYKMGEHTAKILNGISLVDLNLRKNFKKYSKMSEDVCDYVRRSGWISFTVTPFVSYEKHLEDNFSDNFYGPYVNYGVSVCSHRN